MTAADDARDRLLALEPAVDLKLESLSLLAQPRQVILTLLFVRLWQLRRGEFNSLGPVEDTTAFDESARLVSRLSLVGDQIMAAPVQPGVDPAQVWSTDGLQAGLEVSMLLDYAHLVEYQPDIHRQVWEVLDETPAGAMRPTFTLRAQSAEASWAEARDALLSALSASRLIPPKQASGRKLDRAWASYIEEDPGPFQDLVARFANDFYTGFIDVPVFTDAGCVASTGLTVVQFERLRAVLCGYAELFAEKGERVRDIARISGWTDATLAQWTALTTCSLAAAEFRRQLAGAVGVTVDKLAPVLNVLTMGGTSGQERNWGEDFWPPLMLINGRYWFAPDAVLHTVTWRNLAWGLNKINETHFSQTGANTMEPKLLSDATQILAQDESLEVIAPAKFTRVDGKPGDIDALVYSRVDNVVMQIQAKAKVASSSPRMTSGVESEVKIALRQLQDFHNAEQAERERTLGSAFGHEAASARIVDCVLTRAGFGRHNSWQRLTGTAALTPSLLQCLVDHHRAVHGRVRLDVLAADGLEMLDEILVNAGARTDAGAELDLGPMVLNVPFLGWDNDVIAAAWRRMFPRVGEYAKLKPPS